MLTVGVLFMTILVWIGFPRPTGRVPPGSGFMVFWSASHLMFHGSPWQI